MSIYFGGTTDEELIDELQSRGFDVTPHVNAMRNAAPEPSASAASMAERYADVLKVQFDEAMRDTSEGYMVGLYNGMLLICCNIDKTEYSPISASKREPSASVGMGPVAAIMAQAQVFASAWSLVGGQFDNGNQMADAEHEKDYLRIMIADQLATLQAKLEQAELALETDRFAVKCLAETEHALSSQLEQAEKDVRRYKYMRDNAEFRDKNGPGLYWYLPRFMHGGAAELLDSAIDASIAERETIAKYEVKK